MTTLGAFQRSSLGAFIESPLGARDGGEPKRWSRHILVFMFTDESRGAIPASALLGYLDGNGVEQDVTTAVFDRDLAAYESMRAEFFASQSKQLISTLMHVQTLQPAPPFPGFLPIAPPSRFDAAFRGTDPPFRIEALAGRPPALARLQTIYRETLARLPGNDRFVSVLLIVDGSGSMGGGRVIEPTLSEFSAWIRTRTEDVILQITDTVGGTGVGGFVHEQWISFITATVLDRITA